MKRIIGGIVLLLAGTLFPVVAASPAEAKTICTPVSEHRMTAKKDKDGKPKPVQMHADLYFNHCRIPRSGPDLMWEKPKSVFASYAVDNVHKRPFFWCWPWHGNFSEARMRFHIFNKHTGYNQNITVPLPCDDHDGKMADLRGATHLARCYVPYENVGGRAGGVRRFKCQFKVAIEFIQAGPYPNKDYNVGSGYIAP